MVATGILVVVAGAMVASTPLPGAALSDTGGSRVALGPVVGSTTGSPISTVTPLDPAGFAPGACVAFSPTVGDRGQTVFLDAGHGGPDPGAAGTTASGQHVTEKSLTLPVVLDAAQDLRAEGYRVVVSRTTDTGVDLLTPGDLNGASYSTDGKHADLVARVHCANLAGAAVLVSVHFDAYDSSRVRGATTLYDKVRPFSAANHTLADLLQQDTLAALATGGWQIHDRGVASDTTAGGGEQTARGEAYGHLDILGPTETGYLEESTSMPGALVEPMFITNRTEAAIAASPSGQQAIASGITHAVESFLQS